jgi:hypothetical protein
MFTRESSSYVLIKIAMNYQNIRIRAPTCLSRAIVDNLAAALLRFFVFRESCKVPGVAAMIVLAK